MEFTANLNNTKNKNATDGEKPEQIYILYFFEVRIEINKTI